MNIETKKFSLDILKLVQRLRLLLVVALPPLALLGLLFLLGACSVRESTPQDTFALYRTAMKDEHQDHFKGLEMAPRYDIDIELSPTGDILTGTANIYLYNTSSEPWSDLLFRLYPVLTHYGGNMTIHRVLVNGEPTTYIYQANHTAMRLDLMDVLLPDQAVEIELAWRLMIPVWPDKTNVYALFGKSQEMLSLPLFYPALAVYQEDETVSGGSPSGKWWLAEGSSRGDAAFNVTSLFRVTTTLPANYVPVTSGTLITSTLLGNSSARHVWVTGPVREFILHASPVFESNFLEVYGTRITSYWLPGHEAGGQAALNYMAGALRIYHDLYGPYPYKDMRVAPAPLGVRGMEYPQVNLLGPLLYQEYRHSLEILVAHEVAHQWWYQSVHNDPVNEPWLDEAIAEFSVKLYYDALRGESGAGSLQNTRWLAPLTILNQRQRDVVINQPVDDFASSKLYESIIYAKGALFYDALYKQLGREAFLRFIQDYYQKHRYGIVQSEDWLDALNEIGDPTLIQLYENWIEGANSIISADPDSNSDDATDQKEN